MSHENRIILKIAISILVLSALQGLGKHVSAQEAVSSAAPVEPVREESLQPRTEPDRLPDQPETDMQQPPPPTPQAQAPAPLPAKPATKQKAGEVSFNFDDADVFSVIQTIFGDILRVSYIVDPQVKGRVNFRSVSPIPRENVLPVAEIILRLNGIAIVEDAGLYRIIPIADIAKEHAKVEIGRDPEKVVISGKAVMQVVPIRYGSSSEIAKALSPFLSSNAQVIDVPKSNHIILIDTASNIRRLLGLIDLFDSDTARSARPRSYVYSVQNSKARDVANILNQIFLGGRQTASGTAQPQQRTQLQQRAQTTAQPAQVQQPLQSPASSGREGGDIIVSEATRIFPDEIANTVIILATPDDYLLIAETIRKIDVMPRQVIIEGIIAQVDLTDNLSFGLSWSLKTDLNFSLNPFTNDFNLLGDVVQRAAPIANPAFSFVATDKSGNVRAKIEALAKESKAKVLAAPHILVSDNREARIQVGKQVPLVTSTTSDITNPTSIQNTIQYKDIGIILKVKPQINDSGLVALEIAQEISALGEIVAGSGQPAINKTETTTNLVAQDGQTIVIGGLIRDDSSKGHEGIPLLSKIPVLGWLFGYTSNLDTRTELVILLTPRVIRTQTEASSFTSDYVERYRQLGGDIDLNKGSRQEEKE